MNSEIKKQRLNDTHDLLNKAETLEDAFEIMNANYTTDNELGGVAKSAFKQMLPRFIATFRLKPREDPRPYISTRVKDISRKVEKEKDNKIKLFE